MSQYGTIYRSEWQMMPVGNGVTVGAMMRVDISPTDDIIPDDEDPVIIPMRAGASPLKINVADNDEDKFSPIRAKSAVIEVLTGDGIDINTFAVGSDNLWLVTVYYEPDGVNKTVFKGYLVLADLDQTYLPNPVTIVLTASDHLGLLKDITLVDFDDVNPDGKYKMGQVIAMCLRKTGLDLNIRVINNLRHGSGQRQLTVSFNAENNAIFLTPSDLGFFYVGQQIVITGTSTSNGTYTVGATASGIIGVVYLNEDISVNEDNVLATITDSTSALHIYQHYVDAKTFESNIGECEDCYTVLSKILGEDCFLTQYRGEWWIIRLDEIENLSVYVALFNSLGEYQSISTEDYSKAIGSTEDHRFANADQLLRLSRPHGFIEETFRFTFPNELICNIDFTRGDFVEDLDPEEVDDQYAYAKKYDLDCWTLEAGQVDDPETPTSEVYIKKLSNEYGAELDRMAVITDPGNTYWNWIKSSRVPMAVKDKFSFSVDFKLSSTFTDGVQGMIAMVMLYGQDGSRWTYGTTPIEPTAKWRPYVESPVFLNNYFVNVSVDTDAIDLAEQKVTISADVAPLPISGEIVFRLYSWGEGTAIGTPNDIYYSSFSLTYYPYIGGSYVYNGFYNKVSRSDSDYLAKREREVFITDSPKPLFKGAMFVLINSAYVLTSRWYTANTFALGYPPDSSYLHPYGYIQAYSVWNQYNLVVRKFTGSVLGFGSDWPDIIHKYSLTDSNPNADNRFFILLSFEQDWKTGIMSATIIEVYNTETGHVYSDAHTFKYITS